MVQLDDLRSLAARVAASFDLREVRLFNVDASLDHLPTGAGGLSYDYEAIIEVQQVPETNSLIVDGQYQLAVHFVEGAVEAGDVAESETTQSTVTDTEDDDHEHLAHLNFQLAALYVAPNEESATTFPEDELDAFGQTTGMLTLHPYAREFVSSMTGRMGLPSLHLSSVRIPLDKVNEPDP